MFPAQRPWFCIKKSLKVWETSWLIGCLLTALLSWDWQELRTVEVTRDIAPRERERPKIPNLI